MKTRLLALVLLLAAGPSDGQDRPLRAVCIRAARAAQRTRQGKLDGMTVSVLVETNGFPGGDVGVEVRLTGPDGKPIRTPRGTPARYRDERGRVRVAETKRAAGDTACQTPFALFIPYAGIVPPGPRERRVVVLVAVRCGGLSGLAVFGGFLPPMRPPPAVPGLRIDDVGLKHAQDGLAVSIRLDSGALQRGEIQAGVRLRTPDGKAVHVRPNAPAELTGPRGMFDCRGKWNMDSRGASAVPIRLFVPFEVLDLAPGREHGLALTSFAQVGGWRALREQEIRIRLGEITKPDVIPPKPDVIPPKPEVIPPKPEVIPPKPEVIPPKEDGGSTEGGDQTKGGEPPERKPELQMVHPSTEELSGPYHGLAGSHGLDSNLLAFEATVTGLKAGLYCLQVDLGAAGRRCVWTRVEAGSEEGRFSAALPVPCGRFKATLSLPGIDAADAVTFEGEMASHAWAPSQAELEEWRNALDEWRRRHAADDADSSHLVVSTLVQMAGGYLLRGNYDRAAQTCNECLELCTRSDANAAQRDEIERIRIALHLLRGELADLDAFYERWIEEEKQADRRAARYREWADRRAILDPDPSRARELWRKAQQEATRAGVDAPPPPPWLD